MKKNRKEWCRTHTTLLSYRSTRWLSRINKFHQQNFISTPTTTSTFALSQSMIQIILHLAMNRVTLPLSIAPFRPRFSVETLLIRNMQWLAHSWIELRCFYVHVRLAYTKLSFQFKRWTFITLKAQLYLSSFRTTTSTSCLCKFLSTMLLGYSF